MSIVLTDKAASEVKRIIAEGKEQENEGGYPDPYLRLRIVGGGCSGYQNKLDLDPNYNDKLDELFEINGVKVVIDKRSYLYAEDSIIDFHDSLNVRGFKVINPNAKSTCGCGSSWSM